MSRRVGFQTDRIPSTDAPHDSHDAWDDILERDEKILWEGRPDASIQVSVASLPASAFGIFFAGFALIWMLLAASSGGYFWMFGLLHFAIGLSIVFTPMLIGPYRHRHTWYTLTNRRAIIATDFKFAGRNLENYPITQDMPIELKDGKFPDLYFAKSRNKNSHLAVKVNGRIVGGNKVGFERIWDAEEVQTLLHRAQRNLS